jgi:hypothetical protein
MRGCGAGAQAGHAGFTTHRLGLLKHLRLQARQRALCRQRGAVLGARQAFGGALREKARTQRLFG